MALHAYSAAGLPSLMNQREQQSLIASIAVHESWARTENPMARTAPATDRDFVNFYELDDASVELSRRALEQAPPLTDAQLDLISSLIGLTPVDLDAVPEGQLVGGAALDAQRVNLDLVS
jgi:hypothetical protein